MSYCRADESRLIRHTYQHYLDAAVPWTPNVSTKSSNEQARPRCIQNTESGLPRLSTTFYVRFPGLSKTIYVHFPCLSRSVYRNRVDIAQVRFAYNTEYVTQFVIILNYRSNRVCQWTTIMYLKAKNVHGSEMRQPCVYFP